MVCVPIPGGEELRLEHLVRDVNGTLADEGRPIAGVAALGVAVIGPEGAHTAAITAADIVACSVEEALALLVRPRALTATLRP